MGSYATYVMITTGEVRGRAAARVERGRSAGGRVVFPGVFSAG